MDLLDYLVYRNGCYVSQIDYEQGRGWVEVMVPSQHRLATLYLRCKAMQDVPPLQHAPNIPRRRISSIPQITIRPETTIVRAITNPEEMILHVTVPSFTVPVRLGPSDPRPRTI